MARTPAEEAEYQQLKAELAAANAQPGFMDRPLVPKPYSGALDILPGGGLVKMGYEGLFGEGALEPIDQGMSGNAIDEARAMSSPAALSRLVSALGETGKYAVGYGSATDYDNAWDSFSSVYNPAKEQEEAGYLDYKRANPKKSAALEIAGSMVPGMALQQFALPVNAQRALTGPQLMPSVAKSSLLNAGQGAASGFMGGSGLDDRVTSGTISGGIGLVATPFAGAAAAKLAPYAEKVPGIAKRAAKAIKDDFTGPNRERGSITPGAMMPFLPDGNGGGAVDDTLNLSPEQFMLARKVRGAGDDDLLDAADNTLEYWKAGVPVKVEEVDPALNMQASSRALANNNETAYQVRRGLMDRDKEQLNRLYGYASDVSPITSNKQEGAGLLKKAASDRIQQEYDFLHGKVMADGSPDVVKDPGAGDLVYNLAVSRQPKLTREAQRMIARALRNDPVQDAANTARRWEPYKSLNDDSSMLAHQTKRVLNDKIGIADAQGNKFEAGKLAEARNVYREALRDGGNEYTDADEFYSAAKQYIDELEQGPVGALAEKQANPLTIADKLLSMSPDDVKAVKYALGREKWDVIRTGASAAIKDIIDNTKTGFQQLGSVFRTPESKEVLKEIYGKDPAEKLIKRLEGELAITQGRQRITGNSATSDTVLAESALQEDAAMVKKILETGKKQGIGAAAMEILSNAFAGDDAVQGYARLTNSMGPSGPKGFDNDEIVKALRKVVEWRKANRPTWEAQRRGLQGGRGASGGIGSVSGSALTEK